MKQESIENTTSKFTLFILFAQVYLTKRWTYIQIICYAFFSLFVYTAFSKWIIYSTFVRDLHRAPFTDQYATLISIVVPAAELIVAIMLQFKRTRQWGLIGAFLLMAIFTFYVGYVLSMTTKRPCSCGGIFRNMSWRNHMYFNSIATIIALIGIFLNFKERKEKTPFVKRIGYELNRRGLMN